MKYEILTFVRVNYFWRRIIVELAYELVVVDDNVGDGGDVQVALFCSVAKFSIGKRSVEIDCRQI